MKPPAARTLPMMAAHRKNLLQHVVLFNWAEGFCICAFDSRRDQGFPKHICHKTMPRHILESLRFTESLAWGHPWGRRGGHRWRRWRRAW